MLLKQEVPDPERCGDSSPLSQPPATHPAPDSEDSDEEAAADDGGGYQAIGTDDSGLPEDETDETDEEEKEEEEEQTMEEQVAALVRAAQSDQQNLSETTRTMVVQAGESQRVEAAAETAAVWTEAGPRQESIHLNKEKIETIKTLMAKVKLPVVPNWAEELGEDVWREKLGHNCESKKNK